MRYSLFSYSALFGFTQSTIFTWFECTGDLDKEGFSSGMGDGLRRMSKFNMEVVDVFLAWSCSCLCPLVVCFSKKLVSSNPTIMNLYLGTLCYFGGHLKSCCPAKVCMLGKTGLHQPWDKTSWAIECVPIQSCQLD